MISPRNLLKIIFLAAVIFVVSLGARLFAEQNGLRFHTSLFSSQARADAPGCGGGEGGGGEGGGGEGGGGEGCGSSCGDGSSGCGGSCW